MWEFSVCLFMLITPVILSNSFKYLGQNFFCTAIIMSLVSVLLKNILYYDSMINIKFINIVQILGETWGAIIGAPLWFSGIKKVYCFYRNLSKL